MATTTIAHESASRHSGKTPARGTSRGRRLLRLNWAGGTLSWIWLLIVMLPLYWIVITSFKTQSNYFISNPLKPPTDLTLENYRTVIEADFVRYFFNSVVVTAGATVP